MAACNAARRGCARADPGSSSVIAPLRIAPYHTDDPLPRVTSPITDAFGATNTSPETIGKVSCTPITLRWRLTARQPTGGGSGVCTDMEVRRVAAVWANGGCYASAPRADAERAAHPFTTTVISRYTSHAPARARVGDCGPCARGGTRLGRDSERARGRNVTAGRRRTHEAPCMSSRPSCSCPGAPSPGPSRGT